MDIENDYLNNNILQIFIYILADFLELISSKGNFEIKFNINQKENHININVHLLNKTFCLDRNILHKIVEKTYHIIPNDYNFFRTKQLNKTFQII